MSLSTRLTSSLCSLGRRVISQSASSRQGWGDATGPKWEDEPAAAFDERDGMRQNREPFDSPNRMDAPPRFRDRERFQHGNVERNVNKRFALGINRVELMGNLVADPQFIPSRNTNREFASFRIATNTVIRTFSGEEHHKAQFHNIVAFRQHLVRLAQEMRKGSRVMIIGELDYHLVPLERGNTSSPMIKSANVKAESLFLISRLERRPRQDRDFEYNNNFNNEERLDDRPPMGLEVEGEELVEPVEEDIVDGELDDKPETYKI